MSGAEAATADVTTAKRRRYDRQLRLWGEHGQAAMEDCSICLVNGSATGSETLKNLVLPGIGSFTVVDGAIVSAADLGNNFFLDTSCLGRPRAQAVTELLQELNEHVAGSYVNEDITTVLASRPDFLASFSLVIATQMPPAALAAVASACSSRKLPLIVVHTYGFLGYLRLDLGEHQVVESHPAHEFPDLRILQPFPSLRAYVDTHYADLSALSSSAFAHTPWAVLLIRAVDEWKAANGGASALPKTYAQKKQVRAIVESYRREGVQADQNIDEALTAANTALSAPTPSGSVRAILAEARAQLSSIVAEGHAISSDGMQSAGSPSRKSEIAFWLMAAATQQFVSQEGNGLLPLVGTIPDMTADTNTYVALQQLYAQQAATDLATVQAYVREIATSEGLVADSLVAADELKRFCKNSHALQRLAYAPTADEYTAAPDSSSASAPPAFASALSKLLTADDTSNFGALYLLLRAAGAFRAERSRWPGADDSSLDADMPHLKLTLAELVKDYALPAPTNGSASHVPDELVAEFCRWGGAEMHAMASIMGGIASQEAIKAATHQYTPLNNTFIFNGASGTTATFVI